MQSPLSSTSTYGQRRKRKAYAQGSESLREKAVLALERISDQQDGRDQFTIFGEWIASELRNLSLAQATFAKRKLGRAVNEILDEAVMVSIFIYYIYLNA